VSWTVRLKYATNKRDQSTSYTHCTGTGYWGKNHGILNLHLICPVIQRIMDTIDYYLSILVLSRRQCFSEINYNVHFEASRCCPHRAIYELLGCSSLVRSIFVLCKYIMKRNINNCSFVSKVSIANGAQEIFMITIFI
jgi:hypothetical protein